MQFIAVMPHDQIPNKQLALWTMHVNWEPRCFFRLIPNATYDEVFQQFICISQHWSDKLILLENIEYTSHELNSLMQAPITMQGKHDGMQLLYFKDRLTMVVRRDLLDIMEASNIRDNWFTQRIDIAAMARRLGCNVSEYYPPDTPDSLLDAEEAEIHDGVQE